MPLPKPMFEIFMHSPRVEGVHLRGGPVARGGIRWSDRREDFRTEVLGLMKAQMVKNAVIVPVGAKGGFVPRRLPAGIDWPRIVVRLIVSMSIGATASASQITASQNRLLPTLGLSRNSD